MFVDGRILIIDDNPDNVMILTAVLSSSGLKDVTGVTEPRQALGTFARLQPDLVLLDLRMPELDGFEILEQINTSARPDSFLPVIVITADTHSAARDRALSMGANDFITKPFDHTEVILRVTNLLQTRRLYEGQRSINRDLEAAVRERTRDLWAAVGEVEHSREELRASREETVMRLAIAAEFRDDETARHVQRVSHYSALLASASGLDEETSSLIRLASVMHDVGKIGISDHILLKPTTLTKEERADMQRHTEVGYKILCGSKSKVLQVAATIALSHHERFDGSGYPHGLLGALIPFEARMTAVADVFDALTTDRIYRRRYDLRTALRIMREGRGTHFDPTLLDLFFDRIDEVMAIKETHDEERDIKAV